MDTNNVKHGLTDPIKKVLPAVVPELSYDSLNVRDGWMASLLYAQLAQGQYLGDRVQLRADLLAYCGLDTFAMVRILNVLERASIGDHRSPNEELPPWDRR